MGGKIRYALDDAGYDALTQRGLADLGDSMFDLNVAAVRERYGHWPISSLPGTTGHEAFTYDSGEPANLSQAYESLRCWIYQCAEGDIPETPLFKLFDHDIRIAFLEALVERYAPRPAERWA